MKIDNRATPHVAVDDTPLMQKNSMRERNIKVSGKPTPVILRQFSRLKKNCPNKHGDLCLADLDNPQDCEIGLCPAFQMPLKQRAAFLELMENER